MQLLFKVVSAEPGMHIRILMEHVCRALKKQNCVWQFSVSQHSSSRVDGRVMLVSRAETSFLIFFYKLEAPNAAEGESLYAIDFGVKKQANLCHLAVFDIITDVQNELLQEIKRA